MINTILSECPNSLRQKMTLCIKRFSHVVVERRGATNKYVTFIFTDNPSSFGKNNASGYSVLLEPSEKYVVIEYPFEPHIPDGVTLTDNLKVPEYIPVLVSDLHALPALSTSNGMDHIADALWDYLPFNDCDVLDTAPIYQEYDWISVETVLSRLDDDEGKYGDILYRVVYAGATVAYVTSGGRWMDDKEMFVMDIDLFQRFIEKVASVLELEDSHVYYKPENQASFLGHNLTKMMESGIQEINPIK